MNKKYSLKKGKNFIGDKIKKANEEDKIKRVIQKYLNINKEKIKKKFKKRVSLIIKDINNYNEYFFMDIYKELYYKFNFLKWNKFVKLSKKGRFGKEKNYCNINSNEIRCIINIESIRNKYKISSKEIIDSSLLL